MEERTMGLRAVARVIIRNASGEILLCRSRDGRAWVPPGGTLDPGEDLVAAAAREALEEAGLSVEVGPLLYVQEFRPAGGREHVIEVGFLAAPLGERPTGLPEGRRVEPAGDADRPWRAWRIQDVDGPRRECRWFTPEALRRLPEPVYPERLREPVPPSGGLGYLGLVRADG